MQRLTKSISYRLIPGLLSVFWLAIAGNVAADTINVAVASNFASTLKRLQPQFESQTGHRIRVIAGSSGKHYAQITSGAPFDLFLSADAARPRRLELDGRISPSQRSVYAFGLLALWSRAESPAVSERLLIGGSNIQRLALANPALAPYGLAAMQTLEHLGIADSYQDKLVMGENVAQTFQFAFSANAQLGFVALSQVLAMPGVGSYWRIPGSYYQPIRQEMALLSDSAAALELYQFLRSDAMTVILESTGYLPPNSFK